MHGSEVSVRPRLVDKRVRELVLCLCLFRFLSRSLSLFLRLSFARRGLFVDEARCEADQELVTCYFSTGMHATHHLLS